MRKLSFSFLRIGAELERAEPDARVQLYEEIERIRTYLQEGKEIAGPDDADELADRDYFYARLPMFCVPFDEVKPATLYMVGETERTFVALGGQLKDVANRDLDFAKAAEGAQIIMGEPEVVSALARSKLLQRPGETEQRPSEAMVRWEQDVAETFQRLGYYPEKFRLKDYEILALKDEFTRAEDLAGSMRPAKNVLLGKPLFVADG